VNIWLVDLDSVDLRLDVVAPTELSQAVSYRRKVDHDHFLARRTLVRTLLGQVLDRDPASLCFTNGTNGKPHLLDAAGDFSVSSSAAHALVAYTPQGCVGVDIERRRDHLDIAAILTEYFGEPAVSDIDQFEPNDEFLRRWVQHEALAKATGAGLPFPCSERIQNPSLTSHILDLGVPYIGAIATDTILGNVAVQRW
jgi:4'-phosphopantetheinyl transferase